MSAHRIEWQGWKLGDINEGDHFTIEVRLGIRGLGTAPRDTVFTPKAAGGDAPGESRSRYATIEIPGMFTRDRPAADPPLVARQVVGGFMASMQERDPSDEAPLILPGLIWSTSPVQVWARPESVDPVIDVAALGLNDWRLRATVWTVAEAVVFAATATTVNSGAAATSHTLNFTSVGTRQTRSGRAWTATITAASNLVSPYIELGSRRVTWAGLQMGTGQVLTIDSNRHSWVGTQGVDSFRRSNGTPNPDWPLHAPGANAFKVGAASGTLTAQLVARSTW